MSHAETELQDLKAHAENLAAEIKQREEFLNPMGESLGRKAHEDALANRKANLIEIQAVITEREKALLPKKKAEPTPAPKEGK